MIRMGLPRRGISLLQVVVLPCRVVAKKAVLRLELSPRREWVASSRVDVPVSSAVVEDQPGTAVFIVAASVPTIRAHSVALRVRNSEEGRSAIMQAEVIILAAARRELDSARAIVDVLGGFIADCTAAVATACRYLGAGGSGDDQ